MKPKPLTSLVDIPVAIRIVNKDVPTFRPGRPFELPVTLTNSGKTPLTWTQKNTLNLSYRWISKDGDIVERDGLRTSIRDDLSPGVVTELTLGGMCPSEEGEYSLLVSLVLEGRHWATDVGSSGCITHRLVVIPIAAWPVELKDSVSARALRGAIAANDLLYLLEKRNMAEAIKSDAAVDRGTADRLRASPQPRDTVFGRVGHWLQGAKNLGGMDAKIDQILNLANQQDQHFRSLEQQISAVRDRLDEKSEDEDEEMVPEFMENLSEAREKVKIHLLARLGASLSTRGQSRRSSPPSSAAVTKRGSQPRSPTR